MQVIPKLVEGVGLVCHTSPPTHILGPICLSRWKAGQPKGLHLASPKRERLDGGPVPSNLVV